MLDSTLGSIIREVRISIGTFDGWTKDGSTLKRPSLLQLLEWYRYTESGDARDKVYAFVGLSWEQETRPLMVNYHLGVREVFVDVTRYLLGHLQSLKIFSVKKYPIDAEPTLDLPSWVPDFTVQNSVRLINEHKTFAASKGLRWLNPVYLPGSKLQLRGFKLEKISSIGVAFKWAAIPELSLLLQKVNPPKGQTRFETLWRTILLDIFEETTPASMACGSSFLELLERTVLYRQVFAAFSLRYADYMTGFRDKAQASLDAAPEDFRGLMDFEQAKLLLGATYTAFQRITGRCKETDGIVFPPEFVDFEYRRAESGDKTEDRLVIEEFHDELTKRMNQAKIKTKDDVDFQISATATGRLLFVTGSGDLGMGPPVLEVGDEVWILTGADVPLILRPSASSGEYRLVGEAYVHGIMQGEALADVQENDLREVILV